jgi:hypothetical protein
VARIEPKGCSGRESRLSEDRLLGENCRSLHYAPPELRSGRQGESSDLPRNLRLGRVGFRWESSLTYCRFVAAIEPKIAFITLGRSKALRSRKHPQFCRPGAQRSFSSGNVFFVAPEETDTITYAIPYFAAAILRSCGLCIANSFQPMVSAIRHRLCFFHDGCIFSK